MNCEIGGREDHDQHINEVSNLSSPSNNSRSQCQFSILNFNAISVHLYPLSPSWLYSAPPPVWNEG